MPGGKSVQNRQERYFAAAEACIQLARQLSDASKKLTLIDLAAAWMRLAGLADKNDNTASGV